MSVQFYDLPCGHRQRDLRPYQQQRVVLELAPQPARFILLPHLPPLTWQTFFHSLSFALQSETHHGLLMFVFYFLFTPAHSPSSQLPQVPAAPARSLPWGLPLVVL